HSSFCLAKSGANPVAADERRRRLVNEVIVLGEEIDLRCPRSGSADAPSDTAEAATANALQFVDGQFARYVAGILADVRIVEHRGLLIVLFGSAHRAALQPQYNRVLDSDGEKISTFGD